MESNYYTIHYIISSSMIALLLFYVRLKTHVPQILSTIDFSELTGLRT